MIYSEKERWLIVQMIENLKLTEKTDNTYIIDMASFSKPNKYTNDEIFNCTLTVYNNASRMIDKITEKNKGIIDLSLFNKKELKEVILDGKSI